MVTTENSLGLRALRLPHIRQPKSSGQIQLFAVAMGISATSQSSTCENWGLLGSSEFRAFPWQFSSPPARLRHHASLQPPRQRALGLICYIHLNITHLLKCTEWPVGLPSEHLFNV